MLPIPRQTVVKSLKTAAFILLQGAILYVTATLEMLGASFFLSVFVCLELLLGLYLFFWMGRGEREVGEAISHDICLILVSETNLLRQQMEQIQYDQADILKVAEQTDTRIAILKDILEQVTLAKTKGKVRPLVNGTSQQLPVVHDPTTTTPGH